MKLEQIFEYIEVFYNRQRRHQSLDYLSPMDYENSRLLLNLLSVKSGLDQLFDL